MEWVLGVMTILGGVAAIWFFWDKICAWFTSEELPQEEPVERLVDFDYPSASELQSRLEAEGYSVAWCRREKLARKIDLEGWEYVIEQDSTEQKVRLKTGDQILIKKRQ